MTPDKRIAMAVDDLVAVATAARATGPDDGFNLSQAQGPRVRQAVTDWAASFNRSSASLSHDTADYVVYFLDAKRDIFTIALERNLALRFDIILLGVVSAETVPCPSSLG